ncbi:MAG: hypothetical protein H6991_02230 [Pseudomonadales bacterium]|nr:hypothetical protein [Pseudomonadales bacterium]
MRILTVKASMVAPSEKRAYIGETAAFNWSIGISMVSQSRHQLVSPAVLFNLPSHIYTNHRKLPPDIENHEMPSMFATLPKHFY